MKRGKKVIVGGNPDHQDLDLVDNRMNKIASTLDKLNLQLQRFQDELQMRQQDPLVITESSQN
jgi:hypothetical protein